MGSPTPSSPYDDVVLEGYLWKQGSRSRQFWHERYFVFHSDNTLSYFNRKGDVEPKATYSMNELSDCEISDLYVEKHNKTLIYCIKIVWSVAVDAGASHNHDDSMVFDENCALLDQLKLTSSSDLGSRPSAPNSLSDSKPSAPLHQDSPRISLRRFRAPFKKPSLKRRNTDGSKSSKQDNADNGAVRSDGSLSASGLRRRTRERRMIRVSAPEQNRLEIPTMVEVEEKEADPSVNGDDNDIAMMPPQLDNRPSLTPYEENLLRERGLLHSQYVSNKKMNSRKARKQIVQGTKIAAAAGAAVTVAVVTVGIGLVAGLVVLGVGAAAGGGAASAAAAGTALGKKRDGEIVLACEDYEQAKMWKSCLDACLESHTLKESRWGQLFASGGRTTRAVLLPNVANPESSKEGNSPRREKTECIAYLENRTRWRALDGGWASYLGTGVQGLRIFQEEKSPGRERQGGGSNLSVDRQPCAPLKAHVVLSTSALDAFLCTISYGTMSHEESHTPNSGQRASFRIIESIDDHTDVIHLVFRPLYLFPSWTTPRDFVLFRYWRLEPDGSYVICYESAEHEDCPPKDGVIRGEMHQVYTIAPQKKTSQKKSGSVKSNHECLMTAVVQVDPKGWVPVMPLPFLSNQGYGDAFGVAALLQLLDIRDAVDLDRFVSVAQDTDARERHEHIKAARRRSFHRSIGESSPALEGNPSIDSGDETLNDDTMNYDFAYATNEYFASVDSATGLTSNPPPLRRDKWAEPDSNSFRVRGKYYLRDNYKVNAGPSIGRLVAVDVVQVDQPIYTGMSTHPTERVQLALQKERILKARGRASDMPPFIFMVNILLPGPPFFHGVFYYSIDDMSTIDGTNGTPSSKLCEKFFFGDSDEFRHKTFKLIPQIVQGNFIARKAVGSTPTCIGTKLRQLYVRGDRFFEVIVDCGSSSVAVGVIRLSLGYAKTLVIDMGFLFEGDDESTLPERLFGAVRMKWPEFGPHICRLCPQPDEVAD